MPDPVRQRPQRSCVACRSKREKRQLTRLVRDTDGSIHTDPEGRAEGRGAYLCDDPACWRRVVTKPMLLARALRAPAGTIAASALENLAGAPAAPVVPAEGASR